MEHQQEELLHAFREAIEKLTPLTPADVKNEALALADELEADDSTTAEQIRQALVHVGRKEFPYRKAYLELCAGDEEARLQEVVLRKIDDATKALLLPVTKYGVHILDFLESSQFEELPPESKVIIDNAVREAHDVVNRQCDERAADRADAYKKLVSHWTEEAENIQRFISILEDLAERSAEWHDEILLKVHEFEEGFSMLKEDPTQEAVEQEITHWIGVLQESGEEDGMVE